MTVHRELTSHSTSWACAWAHSVAGASAADITLPARIVVDGHAHSLAVQCEIPPTAAQSKRSDDGRLSATVTLTANRKLAKSAEDATVFAVAGVPVCALAVVDENKLAPPLELASCTQVTEINPMFDTAALTRHWVDCESCVQ
jgi:hypothetical protein